MLIAAAPVLAFNDNLVYSLFGLVGSLIFGLVTGLIARSKGHSWAWGVVGFFLPVIGLIIVLLLRRRPADIR